MKHPSGKCREIFDSAERMRMGEPNNVLNVYMSKAARIRSVLEYYLKEKLPPDWNLCVAEGFYTVKNSKGKMSFRQRDIIRRVEAGEHSYRIGIENQETINLIFPWRLLEMDCLDYGRQIEEIQQKNMDNAVSFGKEDDYKYRFRKKDCLEPILSLTLYWGKEEWKEPVSLREMMKMAGLPPGVQKMFQDYKIHIIHMRRIPEKALQAMDSDLKYVIGLMKCAGSKDKYERFIQEHKDYFSRIPKSAVDVINVCTNIKDIMKHITFTCPAGAEEEEADMCKALDDIMRDAEKKGVRKGVRQGVKQMIQALVETCAELGLSKEMTVAKVTEKTSLSKKQAMEFINQYWC